MKQDAEADGFRVDTDKHPSWPTRTFGTPVPALTAREAVSGTYLPAPPRDSTRDRMKRG
jgi:hypothetical protein